MPSTAIIHFDAPHPVKLTPRRLHAAWGRALDLPEGIDPARAARLPALAHRPAHNAPGPKPYSLGEIGATPGVLSIEMRFLDDRLLDTLDAWLALGGVLPIGDGGTDTTILAALEAQVLQTQTWQELAAQNHHHTWWLHLLSPTVFTSHGKHLPGIPPASIATSLHSRWHKWSPETAPHLPPRPHLETILVTEDRTRASTVSLSMPRNDKRGRLTAHNIPAHVGQLRLTAPTGSATAAVFSQLMALAPYTNVGSHASYGMGIINVIPEAP